MDVTTTYQTADLTLGLTFIVAGALFFLGRLFLKGGKVDQEIQEDDSPTTLASRGAFIPVVFGTKRIGPVVGWAGGRFTKEEVIGTADGGKDTGGGGGGNITQTVYYEDGWHQLCLGPASVLHAIYENNKQILPFPISKANTPNGSTVETGVGRFQIFWGDANQPMSDELATRLGGIQSTWPYLCHILWLEKRLGTGATWPSLEYKITSLGCAQNDDIIGTFEPFLTSSNGTITGLNPAVILYQILTAEWPHGAGLDPDRIDFTTLDALGNLFDGSTDPDDFLPMNFHMSDGNNDVTEWLQAILLDGGFLMPDHPEGRLLFMPLREPTGNLPVVDGKFQTQIEVEVEVVPFNDVDQFDRVIFTYKEKALNYRDNTVEFGNDAAAEEAKRYRITKVRLDTVTDIVSARTVANRRSSEILGDVANIRYELVRGASLLLPGQAFEDGDGRVVRVLSALRKTTVPSTTIEAALDSYGLPLLEDGDDDPISGPSDNASSDIQFTFIEVPAEIGGTVNIGIVVLRARRNRKQAGAVVHVSIDEGISYLSIGNQNPSAAGFVLSDPISASDGPDLIEEGPLIVATNFDANTVLNLVGQEAEWQNGRQLMVIEDENGNTEAFFLRNIELQEENEWQANTLYNVGDYVIPSAANSTGLRYRCTDATGSQLSDSTEPDWSSLSFSVTDGDLEWLAEHFEYQAKGLIRSRYSTLAIDFAVADKVWIIETSRLNVLSAPTIITPGETVCLKTQPFTSSDEFNIDNVTAVCKTVLGNAIDTGGLPFAVSGDGEIFVTHTGDRFVRNPGS